MGLRPTHRNENRSESAVRSIQRGRRRVLNQAAHAAVKKNGSYFQAVFRRLLPRLGYQSAIWAVAHRLCRVVWKILHEEVRFIEHGIEPDPKAKMRHARRLAQALRKLGYQVTITPTNLASGMQM
jgi:transposase